MRSQQYDHTTANMTTPNQLMELSHPQSHDNASALLNASLTMTKVAGLSRGVVPAGTDECARWALTNFAAWMNLIVYKPRVKASRRPNDHATLNTHISWFMLETRAKSRIDFYP